MSEESRAVMLLKATLDILQKCDESTWVLDATRETGILDGEECDGGCLMVEIKEYLEEEGEL